MSIRQPRILADTGCIGHRAWREVTIVPRLPGGATTDRVGFRLPRPSNKEGGRMQAEDTYRQARSEALWSFWHKLAILGVAFLGYVGLALLGGAKHDHEKTKQSNWQLTKTRIDDFARTAAQI